jgi:hypothetical protein
MLPTYRIRPSHMRKFPRYNGCLTIEYIPLVLSCSATCPALVFLPEVFCGVYPMVRALMI